VSLVQYKITKLLDAIVIVYCWVDQGRRLFNMPAFVNVNLMHVSLYD